MAFYIKFIKVKVWFQNRRMKHKRQTVSKTDDEESKDDFKGESESQSSSEFGPKTKKSTYMNLTQ